MTPAGFPHSDIPGSQLGCQLPRAYRRLQRPSSALDAKASTMCPSQLATTNTTPHPDPTPTKTGRGQEPDAMRTGGDTPQKKLTQQPPTPAQQARQSSCADTKSTNPPTTQPYRICTTCGYGSAEDARVHYPHLKQQPHTTHHAHPEGLNSVTVWPGPKHSPQLRVRFQNPNSVSPPLPQVNPGAGVGVDGISTNEHHHDGPVRGPDRCWHLPPRSRGVCSLERR